MKPFFSIVIPVYNIRHYIEECVESILTQSFQNFEIILVDDGSNDGSPDECDRLAISDSRIKALHQENQGLSEARNAGIKCATGHYIIFVDGDDKYCDDNALFLIHQAIIRNKTSMVTFNRKFYIEKQDKVVEAHDYRDDNYNYMDFYVSIAKLIKTDCFYGSAWVFATERKYLLDNDLYFTPKAAVEDLDWIVRCLDKKPSIYNMSDVFYLYRIDREGSITKNVSAESQMKYYQLIEKFAVYPYHNEGFKEIILNYIAYQYVLFVAHNQTVTDKKKRKELRLLEKNYKYLLKYDLMRQTKIFHIVSSIVGFRLAEILMGFKLKRSR